MHTLVASVQDFGQYANWPQNVVYVGMPGKPSRAFGIPDDIAIHGKPWAALGHPLGWQTGFLRHLVTKLAWNSEYVEAVRALHGKTLLCWCSRKDAPHCHAVILAEFAELLFHEND